MQILNLKTDSNLLSKLTAVAGKQMSKVEARAQRASFIFGQMGGVTSKEQIQKQLDKQERGAQ